MQTVKETVLKLIADKQAEKAHEKTTTQLIAEIKTLKFELDNAKSLSTST